MWPVVNVSRLAWADVTFKAWIIIPDRLWSLVSNAYMLQAQVGKASSHQGTPDPHFGERPQPNQVNHGWAHVKDEPAYRHANYCHSQVSPATGPQILPIKAIHPPGRMGSRSHRQSVLGWCRRHGGWWWVGERQWIHSQIAVPVGCHSSQNASFHSGTGAALSDPNTGRKVSTRPGIHSTQPLLPAHPNVGMLLSVSMETNPSRQHTQEIMLWRREWGWEG